MDNPTREQIARDIAWNMILRFDHSAGMEPEKYEISIGQLADELLTYQRARVVRLGAMLQRPAQIIGRVIGYIIAAALGVIALAGLLAAVKLLVGVVG